MQSLCTMLTTSDDIIQFEVLDCLSILAKNDHEGDIEYPPLIKIVAPVFAGIMQRFTNPHLIWRLGNFLCSILDKAQHDLSFVIR